MNIRSAQVSVLLHVCVVVVFAFELVALFNCSNNVPSNVLHFRLKVLETR